MRRVFAALVMALNVTLVCVAQAPPEWIKYTSTEGRYSIAMPGQPTLETQDASNDEGIKFKQYLATATDAQAFYMVGYFDYPGGVSFSLDKARDGMVSSVKGSLEGESSISLGGSPGRELRVSAKDPRGNEFLIRARYYDVNRRIYVIQFINLKVSEGPALSEKRAKFFDSFQVSTTPAK